MAYKQGGSWFYMKYYIRRLTETHMTLKLYSLGGDAYTQTNFFIIVLLNFSTHFKIIFKSTYSSLYIYQTYN